MADYSNKKEGKNMIYLLMIIVVLLLVVAIAVIVYLSSRMMSMEKRINTQPSAQATRTLAPSKPKTPPAEPKPKPKPKSKPKPAPQQKERQGRLATEDIATIVQLVMTQMQKNQKTVAPPKPKVAPKRPAEPEPAETETLQPAVDDLTPEKSTPSDSDDLSGTLENVINVLESADVDTVEETQPDLSPEAAQSMTKKQASHPAPKRAKDNFNKVVVNDSATDEFAELGSEIDQLVQAESSSPKEKRYEKVIKKEVAERANEMRTIVVSEGDTLISIAKKAYGDGSKYTKILYANPGIIKNPDRIFVGQVLRVPR